MWSRPGSSGILCVTAPNHHHASTLAPKRGHLVWRGKKKVWKWLREVTGEREEGDMAMFVSLWCCASNSLSSLLWLVQERCQWVPSPVLTGNYLSFMLSWSILMWSVILCTAGAGQLLPGTPKVVVCFQGCNDGQNLASPGHAAWEGCRVHPLLFLFHRNNGSCSFNFRLS